jgi:hypothetical protein
MRKLSTIGTFLAVAMMPGVAFAAEAYMPLGTVVLSTVGMCAVAAAGVVCLKIYNLLRGGDLGLAWQTLAFALLFLAAALLVEIFGGAGWIGMPTYVAALLKLLGALGLMFSFLRFSRVLR